MIINLHKYVENCVIYVCAALVREEKTTKLHIPVLWVINFLDQLSPSIKPQPIPFPPASIRLTHDVLHVNLNGFIDKNGLDYW